MEDMWIFSRRPELYEKECRRNKPFTLNKDVGERLDQGDQSVDAIL